MKTYEEGLKEGRKAGLNEAFDAIYKYRDSMKKVLLELDDVSHEAAWFAVSATCNAVASEINALRHKS